MNQLRQPFSELSPEVYKGLVQASIALEKSELGNALVELVYLRVSQINGCAFCLEMHSKAQVKYRPRLSGELRPGRSPIRITLIFARSNSPISSATATRPCSTRTTGDSDQPSASA